jgi:hypothetical protein
MKRNNSVSLVEGTRMQKNSRRYIHTPAMLRLQRRGTALSSAPNWKMFSDECRWIRWCSPVTQQTPVSD